jgi:hypothetical protein
MSDFDFNLLKDSFRYDAESGFLTRVSNNKIVNSKDAYGYIQVGYMKKMYKAHRLIWAIVYGKFPIGHIDHINGIRFDNRLTNLRSVTHQQNIHNQKNPNKKNKSGYLGVCWNKKAKKWQAEIQVNNKNKYLGVFESLIDAHNAYISAKQIYHSGFILS